MITQKLKHAWRRKLWVKTHHMKPKKCIFNFESYIFWNAIITFHFFKNIRPQIVQSYRDLKATKRPSQYSKIGLRNLYRFIKIAANTKTNSCQTMPNRHLDLLHPSIELVFICIGWISCPSTLIKSFPSSVILYYS